MVENTTTPAIPIPEPQTNQPQFKLT